MQVASCSNEAPTYRDGSVRRNKVRKLVGVRLLKTGAGRGAGDIVAAALKCRQTFEAINET